jgi:GABA permease
MPHLTSPTDHRALRELPPATAQQVLIIAAAAATSQALTAELRARLHQGAVRFHLVVPALNSRLRHWCSDTDQAVLTARQRAEQARAVMAAHKIPLTVEVGDAVPSLAIADALARFRADEILVATLPAHRSHRLEHDLVDLARQRFGLPVQHVSAMQDAGCAA